MAGSAWTNQLLNLIVLSAAQKGFSGFFVYSPAPGPGNLIGSWAAAAGTDPYGNAYPAGLSVDVGSFTGVSLFLYSGPPAAGNLLVSVTAAAGADSFGNNYVAGIATYGAGFAASLNAGFVAFYTGSLAGGWTQGATIETDSGGDLILFAPGTVDLTGSDVTINGTDQTSTATGAPVTSGPNGGVFAGHTHDFAGHTHTL
ncbi:MAG TPA: hypothetical protein VKH61_01115 [Streptosporangiaceae bacterium]|nr:hypothetical protein [Streptosporangiaceae bacterium]